MSIITQNCLIFARDVSAVAVCSMGSFFCLRFPNLERPGVTNVRNLSSGHWRRWLGKGSRCLVPLTSFAEPRGKGQGNQWFASAEDKPMFFAGIEVRAWKSVRKVKEGETTDDLYAFLTCPPNAEVKAIHPKAMPVILTDPDEWTAWLDGADAVEMQRPLPDGALQLVDEAV